MLDIGWTELLVIAVVLIVVVGPKDLPPMLRAFGKMTTRLRKTAGEFRSQFDEALREAELGDVAKTISDVKSLNPANSLREAMNPLRQMGQEIKSDLQRATAVEMPQASGQDAAEEPVEMPSPFPAPSPAAASLAAVPPDLVAAPPPVVPAANAPATPMADPGPAKPAPAVAAPAPEAVPAKPKRAPAKKKTAEAKVEKTAPAETQPVAVKKPAAPRKKPSTTKKDNA